MLFGFIHCIGSLEVIIGNSLFMQAFNCTTDQVNCWEIELDEFCVFYFKWFHWNILLWLSGPRIKKLMARYKHNVHGDISTHCQFKSRLTLFVSMYSHCFIGWFAFSFQYWWRHPHTCQSVPLCAQMTAGLGYVQVLYNLRHGRGTLCILTNAHRTNKDNVCTI